MAYGRRQGLQAQTKALSTSETKYTFSVDRGIFLIHRFKLFDSAEIDTMLIRFESEAEVVYSGETIPVIALFVKTDPVAAASGEASPRVLEFADPLQISRQWPLRVFLKLSAGTTTDTWLIPEGVIDPQSLGNLAADQ